MARARRQVTDTETGEVYPSMFGAANALGPKLLTPKSIKSAQKGQDNPKKIKTWKQLEEAGQERLAWFQLLNLFPERFDVAEAEVAAETAKTPSKKAKKSKKVEEPEDEDEEDDEDEDEDEVEVEEDETDDDDDDDDEDEDTDDEDTDDDDDDDEDEDEEPVPAPKKKAPRAAKKSGKKKAKA